jgi:hypothetical protein
MPHLLANGHFRMVFEHHQNYFHPSFSANGFLQLFLFCFHIVKSHVPP